MKKKLSAILFIVVLLGSVAGCYHETPQEGDTMQEKPFCQDRVATVRILMSEDDWGFMQQNARLEQYAKADMWYDGELIPDIAVRTKGNSSLNMTVESGSMRYSFKADLNFFNSARHLYGVKKLNFNNGFSDPTFMREILAYELFKQMGVPTPRSCFVDIWLNDIHLGLYTMVEQIDKAFLVDHFADSSGNLYKPEMPAASLKWTEADLVKTEMLSASGAADIPDVNLGGGKLAEIMRGLGNDADIGMISAPIPNMPHQGMLPAEDIQKFGPPMRGTSRGNLIQQMALKTNENRADHTLLFRFLEILNNEPDDTFAREIEKVLDVDSVLRFLAVSALIVHLDNYIGMGHNYYLYENDGKFVILPWDLNMSFGTYSSGLDRDHLIHFYIDEPTSKEVADRPLVARLLAQPQYLDAYHQYLQEMLEGPFSVKNMNSRIDDVAALIFPYVETDELKFFSIDKFHQGINQGAEPDGDSSFRSRVKHPAGLYAIGLKYFVAERSKSVSEQLAGNRKSSSGDGRGNQGSDRITGANLPLRDLIGRFVR